MDFPRHDLDSAPAESRETLSRISETFGTIPEAYAVFAVSPAAFRCYHEASRILRECGRLDPRQQQIVMLAVSVRMASGYCVAAHCGAAAGAGVDPDRVERLREGKLTGSRREDALVRFALAVWESGGDPSDAEREAFTEAGYGASEALEVVALIALKVLGGFGNRLAGTRPDSSPGMDRWKDHRLESSG